MDITLKEDVYNILLSSDVAISVKQIKDGLKFHKKSTCNTISQAVITIKNMDDCEVVTFKRDGYDYHVMTTDLDYLTVNPIGVPQMIIRIMADKPYYQSVNEMYEQAIEMGCKCNKDKFSSSLYTVSRYNECEIKIAGKHGSKRYKMVSEPVRPYNKHLTKADKKPVVQAEVKITGKSAVNLLFSGNVAQAAKQNRTMIADWARG